MDLKPSQIPGFRAGANRPGFSNGSLEFLMVGNDTDGCRICRVGRGEGGRDVQGRDGRGIRLGVVRCRYRGAVEGRARSGWITRGTRKPGMQLPRTKRSEMGRLDGD